MVEDIRGPNDPETSEWELREELETLCRELVRGDPTDPSDLSVAFSSINGVLRQIDTFRGKAGECMHPGPATFPFTFNGLAISIHCSCCGRWRSCEPVLAAQEWIEPRGRKKTLEQYKRRSKRITEQIQTVRRQNMLMQPAPPNFDPKKVGN